jgi:superfamily II DNA helicase RecQ
MNTRACTVERKEKIISSLCDPHGTLRIVIATTAFGMGIDCSDIRIVVHSEPPSTLEQYAHKTGRVGRDGLPSEAILYCRSTKKHLSDEMKFYCDNTEQCRRKLIYSNFFSIVIILVC